MMYDARCWRVEGQQLDLLDNRPVIILTHRKTGDQRHIHPQDLRRGIEAVRAYDAGYLHGFSDARAGRPFGPAAAANDQAQAAGTTEPDPGPKMVLGG